MLRRQNKPISYSKFRDLFVKSFKSLVEDVNKQPVLLVQLFSPTVRSNNIVIVIFDKILSIRVKNHGFVWTI